MSLTRITVDLDSNFHFDLFDTLKTALHEFDDINKIIIRHSSRKGFHISIFTRDTLTENRIFQLRKLLGDDNLRIKQDKKRKNPKQYLFKKKRVLKIPLNKEKPTR